MGRGGKKQSVCVDMKKKNYRRWGVIGGKKLTVRVQKRCEVR